MNVVVAVRQREDVTGIGNCVFGITAVPLIAGAACVRAEILAPRHAIAAMPAAAAQPRHADPGADAGGGDAGSACGDRADDLVAGDDGDLRVRQLTVDEMQVGAADAAGAHGNLHLARAGLGPRQRAQR